MTVMLTLIAGWLVHLASWSFALLCAGRAAARPEEWGRESLLRLLMVALIVGALALPPGHTLPLGGTARVVLLAAFLAGQGLAVAGRVSLGTAWGLGVRPRADGARVGTGIYTLLPHPIYAGTALALLAQLALLQNLPALLLAIGAAVLVPWKAVAERRAWRLDRSAD